MGSLKGLDEFEAPEFAGRMERAERWQKLVWYAMLACAVALGATMGFLLF
jgi:hypothetical protein